MRLADRFALEVGDTRYEKWDHKLVGESVGSGAGILVRCSRDSGIILWKWFTNSAFR